MKKTNIAADTNIFVYLRDTDFPIKSEIAADIIKLSPIVSAQVVSEYLNVVKRLFKLPKQEVLRICITDLQTCPIQSISVETLNKAKDLIARYDFQLFDSIVVASALEAGCEVLYSEDFQDGLIVDNTLKIVNPFV